jgi:fatty acid/phospholipid biosynthesis enzyme
MLEKIVVAVDCPGGDPRRVKGYFGERSHDYDAVPAVCNASIGHPEVEFVLVGDRELLKRLKDKYPRDDRNIHIEHEPNVFPMGGKVTQYNGPSTIKRCVQMVAAGDASVECSDGDSGAASYYAWRHFKPLGKLPNGDYFHMSLVKGIPSGMHSTFYVSDIGANKESTPEDLFVSAMLTQIYAQVMHSDKSAPTIGLLDTPTAHAALKYFKQLANFAGIVTPAAVFNGNANVLITDGFTGNIYLKTLEAIAEAIIHHMKHAPRGEKFKPHFTGWPCCETGKLYKNLAGSEYTIVHGPEEMAVIQAIYQAVNCLKETSRPSVGILSNGEEKDKGNQFAQKLRNAFKESPFGTIGFVEPKDLIRGTANRDGIIYDVNIGATDEHTGRIFEQTIEAVEKGLHKLVQPHFTLWNMLLKKLGCGPLQQLKELLSPDNHNGSALLGIRKPAVIGHGAANRKAIEAMINYSIAYARSGYTSAVQDILPHISDKMRTAA